MKIVNLIQGTQEWKEHRAKHFNASDAPAMLGISPYKSRSQLLKELATGIIPDVDDATQRRFNDGHRYEALARPLAENIIGDELSPQTGNRNEYSASFDGITFDRVVWWEHKSLNDELRSVLSVPGVTGADLPEVYQVQLEHQGEVCGGEKCLFMASKWDKDGNLIEELHCWYTPNPALRARIGHGWIQFKKDLADYSPTAEVEKVTAEAVMALPALSVQIKGEVTTSNLPVFVSAADAFLAKIKTVLETDQDFADAEANVKACKAAEDGIEQTKKAITAQATSIDEVMRTMDLYKEKLSTVRLKLDKLVKSEKVARKEAIAAAARKKYDDHVNKLEVEIKPIRLLASSSNFAGPMSGLKKLSAMQEAVDTALRDEMYALDTLATDYRAKIAWCKEHAAGMSALFPDLQTLMQKPLEDFSLIIQSRIDKQKADEAARLEAERARIQAEEEAKARAKVEAEERARVAAETKAQLEAQAKAKAEQDAIDAAVQREHEKSLQGEPAVLQPADDVEARRKAVQLAEQAKPVQNFGFPKATPSDVVEMVTITKAEYARLLDRDDWLGWLEAAGVDNWQGMDEAISMRNEARAAEVDA